MLLNQLFSPKKLFEGGNLASHKADGQPMPGWQGVPGQHQAQELDLNVHNRTEVVAVLSDLLHSINDLFAQQFKEPLWHENSVKAQKFLSGSTMRFFDKKIPDEEFVRVKPTVGDIDTQAPDKHEGTIKQFLTGLIGKQVGDTKFIGFSAGNNQYTSMWQVTLQDMPVKLQIDFEYGAHDAETGLPTPWQEYSHSSSWEDLSAGIKGVFHKYIDRALPYASTVSTKYVARVLKKSTKISDEPVTDSDYSFAVSGQGGGGVSRKYVPYNDPSTGAPMERDGVPVMQLLDPANRQYIQNLGQQFEIFFGRKPKGNDQQLKNSFVGTVDLANKYLDDQQRTELFNRFVSICFEPGSQMITKGDPVRDRTIKMAAIDYMIQNMKLSNPQAMRKQAIKTAMDYEQAFTSKQAGKNLAENTAAGINKMFNNLGDPVFANLQRVALLAMQGRQQEAAGRLQAVIKDAGPKVQQKIIDAVNNIKPVTINGKIADSSTLDKSKEHQDWILKTFIPWVQSVLDKQDVTEAEVKAQFRKNMPHLKDLKPIDFLDLLDELDQGDGKFKLKNIPLNVKVDGFGGRFGKNSEGKPFMATSRTEPRYQAGFVDYHQKKGTTDPEILGRAQLFDDLFSEMMSAVQLVDSKLGPDFLINKQVTCEVLYLPFATETTEGKLKFVGIQYDKLPQGVQLALVPFRVTDATTGEDLPESNKIVKELTSVGRQGSVMFIDNSLTQNEELDVTEIINVLDNIEELKQIVSDTSGKRDRASLDLRKQVEEKLQPVKVELEKAIINDPNIIGKDLLGKDYEGIVINSRLGPIKITSQEQRDVISAKNAAKVSARTEQPRANSNKTAVVAIGSFIGHKGHEELWNYTVKKAEQVGGDPYLFIGNAESKDDPIPPSVKVQTWHKLYPEYAKNISTVQEGGQLIQKIKHELINPLPGKSPRYDNIIIMVGEDRAGINMPNALMKAVNKFQGYEHVKVTLDVTPRGTGISGTALRNSLKNDPPEKALATWSSAFDVNKLGVDWIKHLMDITRKNMGIQQTPQQPAPQPTPMAEMRLFNALVAPKHSMQEGQLDELDMFAPVTTYVRLADGTYVAASWRRNQDLATASNSASFVDIKPVSPNVAKQLGLDQRLNDPEKKYTGAATIASGGPIQATGPFGDKTINVVDIRDPKAAKDNGVPNSIFGKIAQWAQQQDQPQQGVEEGIGKHVASAALAGAMALGGAGAHAQSSGEDYLPDIVAHVTFKVNGKEISKDINLGTTYKSPGEASAALEKFLKSKGIKYFEYSLERVKSKDDDYIDKTPASDTSASGSVDSRAYSATGNSSSDYMAKESIEEATSAAVRMQRAWERQQAKSAASRKRGEELLNPKKKEEPKEKDVAEGNSGAKYKVRSIGHDAKGDYYISPSTGKKVYKTGVKVGDHENPKTGEHKSVAEAPDSKFVGFMNKTLGQKADAPVAKSSMPDFMKNAPVAGLDSMGYRAALNFGMKTLNKLTPTQKTKLSIKGEDGVVSWLASQANKQGLLITDEEDDTQGKFVEEDLQEVQDFLPEVFKDPAIKSWAFVLTDGEPLPKAPVAGPFTVSINPGLPNNNNGYANADWKDLDTLENLPDAVELAKGLAQKNPKQFIGIYDAKGKSAGFYWPGRGWDGLKEGDSPAMAHTAKSLANPPKVMQHRAKRDQEREKQLQYRNISKRDEELDEKIKGADGKACWDGYRYNGTENDSDKCVKIGEAWELEMSHAISKLFENR